MSTNLYKQWQKLIGEQDDKTFESFWDRYSDAEIRIYTEILKDPAKNQEGTFEELCRRFDVEPVLFMGFLDGILTSLNNTLKPEDMTEESPVVLDIDPEKLYFNMLSAQADHLYTLPGWDDVLTGRRREEIATEYKRSRTVVKEKQPGRNDPCPCGSGKKYKKCCGA